MAGGVGFVITGLVSDENMLIHKIFNLIYNYVNF